VERWLRFIRSVGSDVAAGVDSSAAYDGGAIFENPRRGIWRGPARSMSEAKMVASESDAKCRRVLNTHSKEGVSAR